MKNVQRPITGITLGDPAGIGPEVVVKALAGRHLYDMSRPLLVGDAAVIKQTISLLGLDIEIKSIARIAEADFTPDVIDILDLKNVDTERLEYGKVSKMCGQAAFEAIKMVIELALAKDIDATVTAPINKESLNAAGHHFAGHTEIYSHFTDTADYAMLLIYGDLRVAHVSTHIPLRAVCDHITTHRVFKVIQLADEACRKFGVSEPRIGVAGLNPHSSDGGLFGTEEKDIIMPAIEEARAQGLLVDGPVPSDTLFPKAIGGWYDICVAMYHDQGHIPLKAVGFVWDKKNGCWEIVNGVNITLGLPIIRTSVDHGTAFDVAGKGIASQESMISAIEYAVKLAGGTV